jgi:hypothetical protein
MSREKHKRGQPRGESTALRCLLIAARQAPRSGAEHWDGPASTSDEGR